MIVCIKLLTYVYNKILLQVQNANEYHIASYVFVCQVGICTCLIAKDRAWIEGTKNHKERGAGRISTSHEGAQEPHKLERLHDSIHEEAYSGDSNMCDCMSC